MTPTELHAREAIDLIRSKDVMILRGLPGAGKDYFIEKYLRGLVPLVCSADRYFEMNGEYRFEPPRLGQVHDLCLFDALESLRAIMMKETSSPVVINNTNLSVLEITPYARAASAYGLSFGILTIDVKVEIAAARNAHGVPAASYDRLLKKLQTGDVQMPRDWVHRRVSSEVL